MRTLPPTCLITGGAGFIGSHLTEHLLRKGCTVLALDDLSAGSMDNVRSFLGTPALHLARAEHPPGAVIEYERAAIKAAGAP